MLARLYAGKSFVSLELEIKRLMSVYIRLHHAGSHAQIAAELPCILSASLLKRIEPVLEAGEVDPVLGTQDSPDEWGSNISVMVQAETTATASALVILGPPPTVPKLLNLSLERDAFSRWRIDNVSHGDTA